MIEKGQLPRPLPRINEMNRYFWCGGADGRLHIMRCGDCGFYIHPYAPVCRKCLSNNVQPEVVSGRGTVLALTINHQPWLPAIPVPYVIALIELEEQADIRLLTNITKCRVDAVKPGMPVQVYFEQYDDIYFPMFEPRSVQ